MQRAIIILLFSLVVFSSCTQKTADLPVESTSAKEPELTAEEKVWQQRVAAAFESATCPQKTERNLEDNYYQGTLIDTHIHIASIPAPGEEFFNDGVHPLMGVNVSIDDYVCMMDYENTDKVFAFFPVWEPIAEYQLEVVKQTMTKYPDRFAPFIMPPNHDDSPDGFPTVVAYDLKEMLSVHPGMFKGYGEIGLYAREGGAPELPPDSERLLEIYPLIEENNLLVYFHLGEGQKDNFERSLKSNPDINFIWHGDQLVTYKKNGEQDLSAIEDILNKHPNANYGVDELYGDVWLLQPEVTKQEFLNHFKDPKPLLKKDIATWKGFIERHPDQVLWGTDRGWSAPWSLDPEVALTLNNYSRAFIGLLDPSVQSKFAYQNAERLLK